MTTARPQPPAPTFGSARLILFALIMGVVTITVVALAMHGEVGGEDAPLDVLIYMLPVMPIALVPGYVFMRSRCTNALAERHAQAAKEASDGLVPREMLSLAIIGAAMAESVGIFGATIYLLGGPWPVLIAPALAVLLMASQIPTRESVDQFVRTNRK